MKSLGLAWLAATCPNTRLQHAEFQCLLHTITWKDKVIYTPQVVKTACLCSSSQNFALDTKQSWLVPLTV